MADVLDVPITVAPASLASGVPPLPALLLAAANQERFYLQNDTYTLNITDLGFPENGHTENDFYALTITTANTLTFAVQADAIDGHDRHSLQAPEGDEHREYSCG